MKCQLTYADCYRSFIINVWFGLQFVNVISMNSVRYWDPKRAEFYDIRAG